MVVEGGASGTWKEMVVRGRKTNVEEEEEEWWWWSFLNLIVMGGW